MLPVNKRATTKGPSPRSLSRSVQEVSSLPPFYARPPPLSSEILHSPSLFFLRSALKNDPDGIAVMRNVKFNAKLAKEAPCVPLSYILGLNDGV